MTSTQPFIDDAEAGPAPVVMLVDDDEVNLLLTALALRERGFTIIEASGGEQALGLLSQASPVPDLVVLDALMPTVDGFATCARLRRMPGFENLPVLMLTGLEDDESIARAYRAGATDFFVKAAQWSLLAGRLRYLLRASRTRLELERSKSKLARAQDIARMGSFEWRAPAAGRPGQLDPSTEALRVFGLSRQDSLTLPGILHLVQPEGRRALLRTLADARARGANLATDLRVNLPEGRLRIIHVEAEPSLDELRQPVGYTGIVQDVTDRRTAEDRIRHLANFDALTGLPNRRQLIWRTERALEHARRTGSQCALLLIDLDRFKLINDTLGHAAGDEMLIEAAQRLRACVRHSDQFLEGSPEPAAGARLQRSLEAVGRLGGDEFVALLPEVADERDAERVAARVLEALREPIIVSGQECFVTASVGVALFPRDGTTVMDLLRNADVAMYSVKADGRNASSLYSPNLAGRGREKLELESALHKAIERQELVLHYQPKVDVRSASMVGAEALMRWQRGDVLMPPLDFIPLAEESGLIIPLSEWAIREAARQVKVWKLSMGFDASIAVNLPTRMFERSDLVGLISRAVAAYEVPAHSIQIEITETGLMKDREGAIPALQQLNALGVEISIDDFGTGYSSLSYLTTLPISELKVDRSFVRDLGVTPRSSAVVTAIIALARSLGLRVVAEGVENLRQMEVLHRLGCSVMQGFLFSRAITPDALEQWIEQTVLPRKAPWIGQAGAVDAPSRSALGGAKRRPGSSNG